MRCGKVCIHVYEDLSGIIRKTVFLIWFSANRFDKRPDEFGAGLDSFLNPTMRCNGFLSSVPSIEVRAYVSF